MKQHAASMGCGAAASLQFASAQMPDRKFPAVPRLAVQGLQVVRSVAMPLTVLEVGSVLHQLFSPPAQPKHGPLLPGL